MFDSLESGARSHLWIGICFAASFVALQTVVALQPAFLKYETPMQTVAYDVPLASYVVQAPPFVANFFS